MDGALHDRASHYNQDECAFFPRFFIFLQAVNTDRVRLLARMLVPPQDFLFLAS